MMNGDVACRVDEFQVEQGEQFVVLQAGFLKEVFDVANVFGSLGSLALVTVANQSTFRFHPRPPAGRRPWGRPPG